MPMLAFTVVVQSQTSLYSAASQQQKKVWLQQLSFRCGRQNALACSYFFKPITTGCSEGAPAGSCWGEPVYCSLWGVEPWLVYVRTVSVSQLLWACFVLCFHSGVALFLPPSSLSLCGRPHLILLARRYKVLLVLMCRSQSDWTTGRIFFWRRILG